jgi:hypothetical protein
MSLGKCRHLFGKNLKMRKNLEKLKLEKNSLLIKRRKKCLHFKRIKLCQLFCIGEAKHGNFHEKNVQG